MLSLSLSLSALDHHIISMSSMVHPFDLPEIRSHIAEFMTRQDLALCSSVSRGWSQTCLPILWHTLALAPAFPHPNVKLHRAFLVRYTHLIKELGCIDLYGREDLEPGPFSTFFKDICCQNLESLTLSGHINDRANLIYRHRLTLVHLDLSKLITGNKALEGSDEIWQALASCPSLESLSVSKLHVSPENWPICWSLWSRLTCLRLLETNFSSKVHGDISQQPQHRPSQTSKLFELLALEDPSHPTRLKTLELRLLQRMERLEDHLALLKVCPDLEEFVWFVNPEPFSGKQLGRQLGEQVRYCPRLTNITLGIDYRNEGLLVKYLESGASHSLQELNLPSGQFELNTWKLLREHHWGTLRTLDVSAFAESPVVHDILCSLTGLESLTAYTIRSEDMISDPRPWACLRLKWILIAIEMSEGNTDEAQKVTMNRLGTLTRLQYLKLRPIYGQVSLQFRLTGHLGRLETWRDFQTLIFQHVSQDLTENDVRWMTEKWPRLHSVVGQMHPVEAMDTTLKKILLERGVQIQHPSTNVRISCTRPANDRH